LETTGPPPGPSKSTHQDNLKSQKIRHRHLPATPDKTAKLAQSKSAIDSEGDMKLVRQGAKGGWELYDMAADRTELNNLAIRFADQAKALAEKWEAWAERAQVNPFPSRK